MTVLITVPIVDGTNQRLVTPLAVTAKDIYEFFGGSFSNTHVVSLTPAARAAL